MYWKLFNFCILSVSFICQKYYYIILMMSFSLSRPSWKKKYFNLKNKFNTLRLSRLLNTFAYKRGMSDAVNACQFSHEHPTLRILDNQFPQNNFICVEISPILGRTLKYLCVQTWNVIGGERTPILIMSFQHSEF